MIVLREADFKKLTSAGPAVTDEETLNAGIRIAALANAPESVNSDPYGEGWMIKMTVDNPADVEALLDAAAYEEVAG